MLGQLLGQAEAQTDPVAEPDHRPGETAPEQQDQGKGEDDRQPLAGREHQRQHFLLGLVEFQRPAIERAVIAGELFFEVAQGAADQSQYSDFSGRLGFFRVVPELFQVAQQLAALLIVLQILDDLIQGLGQRFGRLWLGFLGAAQQAWQADSLGGSQWQQGQQANQQAGGQSKKTGEH